MTRTNAEPIYLFRGGDDGALHAINPGADTYHWSVNFDCRPQGRAVPANVPIAAFSLIFGIGDENNEPVAAAFEWSATNGSPNLIIAGGSGTGRAFIIAYADEAVVLDGITGISFYKSGVLYRYDQDATVDPDEEMAFFCNGSGNDVLRRRKKSGTVDAGATTPHTAKADVLAVVGGDLWRAGGVGVPSYKVSKLTVNTDPGIETNWLTPIPVGRPSWPVNKILNLGGSPHVVTGEGVFKYNAAPSTAEFLPVVSFDSPHTDNGKASFADARGRLYVDTVEGHILVIEFGTVSQQTPTRFKSIDRDTPIGRITDMTADLDHVYAAVQPGTRYTQDGVGLKVLLEDGGSFSDVTTNVTDRLYASTADVSLLTSGGADFIWIGADEPFLGAFFKISTARTSALLTNVTPTVAYGISGGTYQTALTHDSTAMFARDGLMTIHGTDYLDLKVTGQSSNPWAQTTVNGQTKYWMRITPSGLLTGATIREIGIVPYRPPIDPDLFPISAYAISGCLPKVLVGTYRGESLLWHDSYTLASDQVDKLVVARAHHSGATGDRALYAIANRTVSAISIGADADPSTRPWPKLADYGEALTAMDQHILGCSGVDFGATTNIDRIVIEGDWLQDDDEVWLEYRWDNDQRWERSGPHSDGFPIVVEPVTGRGRVFYGVLFFKDGSRTALAPYFTNILIPPGAAQMEDDEYRRADTKVLSPQAV